MCIEDDFFVPHITEGELRKLNISDIVMYEGLDGHLHKAIFFGYGNYDMRYWNCGDDKLKCGRLNKDYVWLINHDTKATDKLFGASIEKVYSV